MSNEDEKSGQSTPNVNEKGDSLGAALESSLQAGLQSLSDGLGNLVEESTDGPAPGSRKNLRPRPSRGRKRANQTQRGDNDKQKQKKPKSTPESNECLLDTRLTDGEFVVIADMLGAGRDDISAGISPRTNELVIRKTEIVVGRVDLPWPSPEIQQATFKNGILEIHVKSGDSESLEESSS